MRPPRFLMVLLVPLLVPACMMAAEPLTDGRYMVEAALFGGSGRAGVESPVELRADNNELVAVVIWSSPYYEYMLVNGTKYYPVNDGGNSTFEIPVVLDVDIAFSAQTIAMSQPHQIDYVLRLDSSALRPFSKDGDASSALNWIIISAAFTILVVFGFLWKRNRRKAAER